MLLEAINRLTTEGNTRARALLKLTTVEWNASRYNVALDILVKNAYLFAKINNDTTKGNYHNELAVVLRHLAKSDSAKREELLQQAITEFKKADHHFQLAKNNVFRASVKNNVALILLNLSRFSDAQKYLDAARRIAVNIKNKVQTAEIDESRAQVLIAENRFEEAESVARGAVKVLEKSGQQCLLADALITHGIALARSKQIERAQFTFQKAVAVAHQVGALNKAGLAALSLIEELQDISSETLYAAYHRASDWLSSSQSPDLLLRLNAAARKIFLKLRGELNSEDATQAIVNTTCDLPQEVLKFEAALIRRALAQANGSVTRASSLLSMSYQALGYVIESRHKDLLKDRSPIRRRSRRETERQQDSVNS
jgi:tetratricopeptide (TPR) repeat protein